MTEQIFEAIRNLPPAWVVVILSALPVSELRGGLPAGLLLDMSPCQVIPLAMISNVVSVIPVVLGFKWVTDRLADKPVLGRFLSWLVRRARAREATVEKYGVFALTIFVAIPLPVTGAWTGSVVAVVFGMKFWKAMLCITLGVAISATIVTLAYYGGVEIFQALSAPAA